MATHTFLEIEAKFAVDASTAIPDLCALKDIATVLTREKLDLSAVYYDTKDLRLTRSKITLRRRTGGNDAGWHIKLPGVTGRKEIRAALEESDAQPQVPTELLAQVRSIVRSQPLLPIAQVDNQRTEITYADASGKPVVEFCDDHVTAHSFLPAGKETSWREWEVELAEGVSGTQRGTALLEEASAALVSAGAFAATSGSKLVTALGDSINNAPLPPNAQTLAAKEGTPAAAVVEALRANRDKLIAFDPKVRSNEWDSIHQMRVATRELRSHLETFHGIIQDPAVETISRELKALAALLGTARDVEVVEQRWKSLLAVEDSGTLDDATIEHLTHDMGRAYRRAHCHIIAALNSERYLNLLEQLDLLLSNPSLSFPTAPLSKDQHPVGKKARKAALKEMDSVMAGHLAQTYNKLVQRHKKATENWDNDELSLQQRENYFHDMRKAAKKLRYAAEAAGSAAHLNTKAVYKACKVMQEVLGDFQDSVTSRDKLVELAKAAHRRGEDTFGYGLLYQRERAIGLEALENYKASYKAIKAAFKPLRKHL